MALVAVAAARRAALLLYQPLAEFSHHEARNLFARRVSIKIIALVAIGAIYSQSLGECGHYLGEPLLWQAFENLKTRRGFAHYVFKRPGAQEIGLALMAIIAGQLGAILVLQAHCVVTHHQARDVFSGRIGVERCVVTKVALDSKGGIKPLHRLKD